MGVITKLKQLKKARNTDLLKVGVRIYRISLIDDCAFFLMSATLRTGLSGIDRPFCLVFHYFVMAHFCSLNVRMTTRLVQARTTSGALQVILSEYA